jgi:uncharacterized protein
VKALVINYLVDAGPLVGLLSERDQWHEWSWRTLAVIDEPLLTTETALAEVCHFIGRYHRSALLEITAMLADGRLGAMPVLSQYPARIGELLAKYPLMDAGDATLVVLSELYPKAKLITVDDDFRRYRRSRNQGIPVVMPESS